MKSFATELCGEPFKIWNGQFWGRCFEQLVILLPSFVVLCFLSAYYIGYHGHSVSRFFRHSLIIHIRIAITAVLCVCSMLNMFGSRMISGAKFFMVDYLTTCLVAFGWVLHIGYLVKLKYGITQDCRGPFKILASFVLCLTSSIVNLICLAFEDSLTRPDFLLKICSASLTVIMQVAYCLTLIPEGKADDIDVGHNVNVQRRVVSPSEDGRPLSQYATNGYTDGFDVENILQPAESKNIFSKVFFWWLNPLIEKGAENCLREIKDLFALPPALRAMSLFSKISSMLLLKPPERRTNLRPVYSCDEIEFSDLNGSIRYDEDYKELSLSHCLFKCFGWEYIGIGILKLLSDGLAFSGPLLLNAIVSYLENHSGSKQEYSYWYAFALFAATLLGALVTTQYNFQVGRIGLKIRATTIAALYAKVLALNKIKLSSYSTGQIMNFMSTDTDRIVNFCQSFHQFWSLPVQVIIIFYFLYQQVGFSFVVGLVFAVVVILLNQYIAKKIVVFSTTMMEAKDKRIKVISELIRGVKSVKIHAWEDRFTKKITEFRKEEISFLMKRKYLDAFCVYLWATTPLIVAFLTFTTFVLLGNTLSASKIFTSIALFNMLIVPLNAFPWVLNGLMEAWVSLKRIQEIFRLPSLYSDTFYGRPRGSSELSISEGIFGYGRQGNAKEGSSGGGNSGNACHKAFYLGPLDIQISEGQLVCIIGKVGSGKSTLLCSILGDTVRHRGTVGLSEAAITEGIGFVSQEPWIQRGTIKGNIVFRNAYLPGFYYDVLGSCGLDCDLRTLRHGDLTEVGENGFTLSGGQRMRISLARAIYQNAEVYLIDDPFSSVDADVAELIFNNCILGLLKGKTIVMCTHHLEFASKADYVIVLSGGKIISQGHPKNVLSSDLLTEEAQTTEEVQSFVKKASCSKSDPPPKSVKCTERTKAAPQLVEEEESINGGVKCKIYKSYWNAAGSSLAVFVLVSCLFMQFFRTLSDWWLSHWVSETNGTNAHANASLHTFRILTEEESANVNYYLYVYGALVAINSLFAFARAFSFAYAGILAAVNLHNQLLQKVMKVSISFFDVNPMGRILNRFSSDVCNADDTLPFAFNILLSQLLALVGCLAVTSYGMSWVACIFIPLMLFYYRTQKLYRCASRELKRLSSVTLSPMYAHFTETINGHPIIRAFRKTARFTKESMKKLDENNMAMYATMAAAQWLNLRLQFIGVLVVTWISITALLQNEYGEVDPGLVGLTLSYALSLQALLNGAISAYTETEKEMISVERILQYAEDLIPEDNGDNRVMPPCDWPTTGTISFMDVYLQYRPERFPVVEAASFDIKHGQKIGIVGRTGSGKTTVIMSLLRMVNIVRGKITIDGLDISTLDLKALRSRVCVIPQDPFLFDGTVRENLDPSNSATDEEIMVALDRCYMLHKIVDIGGLAGHIREGGQNFSTGEKQLLCLVRAILRKCKLVCMDEATANIDKATDDLVQKTIRAAFSSTTVLIIAHRLTTVRRCDFILIMDQGKFVNVIVPDEVFTDGDDISGASRFFKDLL